MAAETQTFSMASPTPITPDCDSTVMWLSQWNTEPHAVETFFQCYPDFAGTSCMVAESQTFSMASPTPTTPDCDPTVAWLSQWDAAETFPSYCFNLKGMDAEIQAAPITPGYDSTASPRSEWGAEPYATEPFPPYDFNAIGNMDENWGDLPNFASWPHFEDPREVMSIKPSQERPYPEGLKSIEDSATTGESELRKEQESPEELDWPEELESTKNPGESKEPRPFELLAEIAQNENNLLDGEVIKFIRESCEPVATMEISSDQSRDTYESHGSISLSNNDRPLTEREVEKNSDVDIPSKSAKRKRLVSESDEELRRSERRKAFKPEYNENEIWKAMCKGRGGRSMISRRRNVR